MATFTGKFIEVTAVKEIETLAEMSAKLQVVFPDWQPAGLRAEQVTVVEFKFATADGKLPQPNVGEAAAEFAKWVRDAVETGELDTTQGIIFSGVMIGHISFALGEASHIFPWAGTYEPRINGAYIGHVHGAPHSAGEVVFLPAPEQVKS